MLCRVAEIVPSVITAPPLLTMSAPPKPMSRDVVANQTLRSSAEKPIQNPDYASSESAVIISTEVHEIGGSVKKVCNTKHGILRSSWHCMCQ